MDTLGDLLNLIAAVVALSLMATITTIIVMHRKGCK